MNKTLKGKVIKGVGGLFTVRTEEGLFACKARKKTRFSGSELLVGDNVEILTHTEDEATVEKVFERKNSLIRPKIANIDKAFIVITTEPYADLLLIDKIIVNCIKEHISPYLVINKTDIVDDNFKRMISDDYGDVASRILYVCAANGDGVDTLTAELNGSVCCFVGQSAVGKTSLLNAITGSSLETGGLSKIMRGRHTTRHNEIFAVNGGFLVDTAGFSLLEEMNIPSDDLSLYYAEFTDLAENCRFNMCNHINEPDCAVKKALQEGKISKGRYERYVDLYKEIKEEEKRRYS